MSSLRFPQTCRLAVTCMHMEIHSPFSIPNEKSYALMHSKRVSFQTKHCLTTPCPPLFFLSHLFYLRVEQGLR